MSEWVTEKMAGHCGARLSGVSLLNATHSDLEQMRSALFELSDVSTHGSK